MGFELNQPARIAPLSPEDIAGMREVIYRTWLATYPNAEHGITLEDIVDTYEYEGRREEETAGWLAWLANPAEGFTVLVAKHDGRVVGVCLVIKHADQNKLDGMYVLPEHQGQGIGTALWQAAQDYLDPDKHTIVTVVAYTPAVKFYQSLGFVDTGKHPVDSEFKFKSGAVFPEVEMRL